MSGGTPRRSRRRSSNHVTIDSETTTSAFASHLDPERGERYLASYGQHLHIGLVHVDRFDLLEKNARYMTTETFHRLAENISTDGALEGSVLGWWREEHPERLEVESGNHRVQGVRAAVKKNEAVSPLILTVWTEVPLTRDQLIAKQLSHNAIVGQDDPVVLKELWDEIGNIDMKLYAGLDDKTVGELEKVNLESLRDVNLNYVTCQFVFLPHEMDRVRDAFDAAREAVDVRKGFLADRADYDRFLESLATASAAHDVKNVAVALGTVLDVFDAHLEDLAEGWIESDGSLRHKGWVPLSSIFGTAEVPAEAARVIKAAVDRMVGHEAVSPKAKWQSLEFWAADELQITPGERL